MNGDTRRVVTTLTRKQEVGQSAPPRHTRLRQVAEELSRRNVDQATCELFNEALARLILLAYEEDAGGFCNIDAATGKLLIPLPWGKVGHHKWGLTPREGKILRRVMQNRQLSGVALFFYERSRRSWYLNLSTYPDQREILDRYDEWDVSIVEYRQARGQL